MKTLKMLISVAIICLVVGVSGTALAVDCSGTIPPGETVDEIRARGQSCYIQGVIVTGDIVIVDGEDVEILQTIVDGRVRVLGSGTVTLVGNRVQGGLRVRNNEIANLFLNAARNIAVINNLKAGVKDNVALTRINCRDNNRIDANSNEAPIDDCRALGGGELFEGEPEL